MLFGGRWQAISMRREAGRAAGGGSEALELVQMGCARSWRQHSAVREDAPRPQHATHRLPTGYPQHLAYDVRSQGARRPHCVAVRAACGSGLSSLQKRGGTRGWRAGAVRKRQAGDKVPGNGPTPARMPEDAPRRRNKNARKHRHEARERTAD